MQVHSILQTMPWPGNWNEGATKIQPGSSQLFLHDQNDVPTQSDLLADLSVTSIMAKLQVDVSASMLGELEKAMLHGQAIRMEWQDSSDGGYSSPTPAHWRPEITVSPLTTSTKSLRATSTRAAPRSRSCGISPAARLMPQSILSSAKTQAVISRLAQSTNDFHHQFRHQETLLRMYKLEEFQGGLSVHWPPGQRIMMISPAADRHRYET